MQNSNVTNHVATLYRFCAQSMQYPEPHWFTDEYFTNLYALLETLDGHKELNKLKNAMDSSNDPLEDLQVEHTRLFINGFPHVAAPPYASVYLEKTLKSKFSDKIVSFYHSLGYTMTANADLPDSLVHQLEFLSFLAEDRNQKAEEEFLTQFFLPWFPIFSARVKEEAQHPFYHIIMSIIDFFTKEDEEYGVQLNEA
jgi:TorA maturation chaperone TorD